MSDEEVGGRGENRIKQPLQPTQQVQENETALSEADTRNFIKGVNDLAMLLSLPSASNESEALCVCNIIAERVEEAKFLGQTTDKQRSVIPLPLSSSSLTRTLSPGNAWEELEKVPLGFATGRRVSTSIVFYL